MSEIKNPLINLSKIEEAALACEQCGKCSFKLASKGIF